MRSLLVAFALITVCAVGRLVADNSETGNRRSLHMKVESTVNSNYTSLNTEVNMVSSPTYYGWTTNAYCGRSVADVGDFNDDGFSDFAVSCPDAAVNGLIRNGLVFVIFGTGAGIAVGGQLQTFTAGNTSGFTMFGATSNSYLGRSVSGAGDVNGDGFDDIVVGSSQRTSLARNLNGNVYVVFGKNTSITDINFALFTTASGQGLVIHGAATSNFLGIMVGRAGDMNDDGFADVIMSAQGAAYKGRIQAGIVYVIYGAASFAADLDLLNFVSSNTTGRLFGGSSEDERLGGVAGTVATTSTGSVTVTAAGDINNDGFPDLLIGAISKPIPGGSGYRGGGVYVVYGAANFSSQGDLDLLSLVGDHVGFEITSAFTSSVIGGAVNAAGDVNSDGIDDFIIGCVSYSYAGYAATGAAFVIFGKTGIFANFEILSGMTSGTGGFSAVPSAAPSASPSAVPSAVPSASPSAVPSAVPSASPSVVPSAVPSAATSGSPSCVPSVVPSAEPTAEPTASPSSVPSAVPSVVPSTVPSVIQSAQPSVVPSVVPSESPSAVPSQVPSFVPTAVPSTLPSAASSVVPSTVPSAVPSAAPSTLPSAAPSEEPSAAPSHAPSRTPSVASSFVPSVTPSATSSTAPTAVQTLEPTMTPTDLPTEQPSVVLSGEPTVDDTSAPTVATTSAPSTLPTFVPSARPTAQMVELVLTVEQTVFAFSIENYNAQKAACNRTIQATVAAAMDGVTPDRVTDITVRTTITARSVRGRGLADSTDQCTLQYTIKVYDPALTFEALRAQLTQSASSGKMDEDLRHYAGVYGAGDLGNVTFAVPTVTPQNSATNGSNALTSGAIAAVVIGIVMFVVLILVALWFGCSAKDQQVGTSAGQYIVTPNERRLQNV